MGEELISREAALTWMDLLIEDSRKIAGKDKLILRVCDIQQGMRDMVAKLPAIDPASLRPKGEWIPFEQWHKGILWKGKKCSCCNFNIGRKTIFKYCPNCGADMRPKEAT